ncbi:MAG: DegQ family serine endoprotease [Gammaproteobacteria bacterium]
MTSIPRPSLFFVVILCLLVTTIRPVDARDLPDFVPLVKQNTAAVVNISSTSKKSGSMPPDFNIPEGSPFRDFFEKFFGEGPEGKRPPNEDYASLGSGFIISEDGYLITNNHVIKDADEVIVRMSDRREFVAEVIGTDRRSDLAVLKIDAEKLPTVTLGTSENLEVGEWVLAIGSPFGFDYSVTTGIISAIGRSLPNENYVPFIQTDAAINPGNSGGPLFNLDGEVIGVNSQIYSRTGGFMGLSFAVPIDVVKSVYKQLREKGHVSRGWLGVLIQDVTRELAESFDMDYPHGALVAKVLPDSPAEEAGLEVGDIITRFDGKDISFSSDLPPIVGASEVDEKVSVDILRRGKKKTLGITIAELPEDAALAERRRTPEQDKSAENALNITVENPTSEQRQSLGLEKQGVLVTSVSQGAASQAGIRRGDVIMLINNENIDSVKTFNDVVEKLPRGKSIPVLIQRRGNPIFLALKLEE